MRHPTRLLLYSAVIPLLFSCAHQVGPGGGLVDEVPPRIVTTIPQSGSLRVPVASVITMRFSEWVDIRSVKRSVSIFPSVKDGFVVDVRGKKMQIKPRKAFVDSTTYRINMTTTLTDLHNIAVKVPFTYFFSTGSFIDSGMVYGCIVTPDKLKTQPKVVLFRAGKEPLHDSVFLKLPDYLTQTDSAGFWELQHIRKGTYTCIAFDDADNNNRFTVGKDRLFIAEQKTIPVTNQSDPVLLYPANGDTAMATIKTLKAISPTVLLGEWTWLPYQNKPQAWRVLCIDTTKRKPQILGYYPVGQTTLFAIMLKDSLTTGSYMLEHYVAPRIVMHPESVTVVEGFICDSLRFNGTNITDTSTPYVKETSPAADAWLKTTVQITWTKPVKSRVSSWFACDSLGDTVTLTIDTAWAHTTVCTPTRSFLPEQRYEVRIPYYYFVDLTGNAGKKSPTAGVLDTVPDLLMRFTTMTIKKLCFSVSGSAACSDSLPSRMWEFKPFGGAMPMTVADVKGTFRFDSLPASKGTIGYYADHNHDRTFTEGRLFPWRSPEPYISFTDTIEARANWDVEGISVPNCMLCVKRVFGGASKDTARAERDSTKVKR